MQKQFAIASLSVLIFLISSSLVAGQGTCPRIAPLKTFNTKLFAGLWWMYAVSPESGPITNSRCQRVEYTYVNNNELWVTEYGVNGSNKEGNGSLKQTAIGQFDVTLPRFNGKRKYEILNIDYDDYFVVHNCQIVSGAAKETKIIYTRSPNPSLDVINRILKGNNLFLKDFKLTDLRDCKY